MSLRRNLPLQVLGVLLSLGGFGLMPVFADWRDDAGYTQLSAELGAALPTGVGVVVLQSEAGLEVLNGPIHYLPQASTVTPFSGVGFYAGKTFNADSGFGPLNDGCFSNHANSVAAHLYGPVGSSLAPGVTEIHMREANDFIDVIAADAGPPTLPGTVSNHSWVGSTNVPADDVFILHAFDKQIDQDGIVACVPLNNNTGAVPQLVASSYHALCVGLRNGVHSRGGTVIDGVGRMKPDLVVNEGATSYASPAVASAAAMLRGKITSSFADADHPQAIKAILLAGASKTSFPAWHRASAITPYDSVFGAGELNVLNAYHILAQGRQTPGNSMEANRKGWDYRTANSTSVQRYFFSIPDGSVARTLSATLTWHRNITLEAGVYSDTFAHLALKLYAANNLAVTSAALDQSASALDNVQHLFQRNLPAGQYALEVSSDTDGIDYGLAWEAQTGSGPALTTRLDTSGHLFLDLAQLDPYVTYTIQQSPNLTGWTTGTTVRTANTTASTTATWQDTSATMGTPKFYRLQWTALR